MENYITLEKNNKKFFNFQNVDGYNKPFNFIAFGREAGKTTAIEVVKTFKALLNNRGNVIHIKRYENDINIATIKTVEGRINRFYPCEFYEISGVTNGAATIKIKSGTKKLGGILTYLWLGRIQKLKNLFIKDVKYILWDEYNINPESEKYEPDEFTKFKEFYETIQRFSKYKIKCYFLGNTYSKFSPFCEYWKIPYNKIRPGCKIIGDSWAYFNFQFTEERKKELLEKSPIYKHDKLYAKSALDGKYIYDDLIKVIDNKRPIHFKLSYYFFINNTYLAVFKNYSDQVDYKFYIEEVKEPFKFNKCKIYTFTRYENSLNLNHTLFDEKIKEKFLSLNKAIQQNKIRYNNINSFDKIGRIFNNYCKFI